MWAYRTCCRFIRKFMFCNNCVKKPNAFEPIHIEYGILSLRSQSGVILQYITEAEAMVPYSTVHRCRQAVFTDTYA